jgi:hypothetical protein
MDFDGYQVRFSLRLLGKAHVNMNLQAWGSLLQHRKTLPSYKAT